MRTKTIMGLRLPTYLTEAMFFTVAGLWLIYESSLHQYAQDGSRGSLFHSLGFLGGMGLGAIFLLVGLIVFWNMYIDRTNEEDA